MTIVDLPYTDRELRVASHYARLRERERVLRIPRNLFPVPRVAVIDNSTRCRACGKRIPLFLAAQEGRRVPRDPYDLTWLRGLVCEPCRC